MEAVFYKLSDLDTEGIDAFNETQVGQILIMAWVYKVSLIGLPFKCAKDKQTKQTKMTWENWSSIVTSAWIYYVRATAEYSAIDSVAMLHYIPDMLDWYHVYHILIDYFSTIPRRYGMILLRTQR